MHPERDPHLPPGVASGRPGDSSPHDAGRLTTLVGAAARDLTGSIIDDREDLRRAVVALVASLKADGEPPERVLVAVKAAVLEGLTGGSVSRVTEIRTAVVRWCVDAYYATE